MKRGVEKKGLFIKRSREIIIYSVKLNNGKKNPLFFGKGFVEHIIDLDNDVSHVLLNWMHMGAWIMISLLFPH